MTHGIDFQHSRTLCPEALELSVRQILDLPEILRGRPQLLAGARNIDRPVRWVHILESSGIADFVSGDELVLTTAVGWGTAPNIGHYVESLARAGVRGLVLELGTRFKEAPPELVQACEQQSLPLVVLRERIRFVAVTEAVHRHILGNQMEVLSARDQVNGLFNELIRNGAPMEHIVNETARLLAATVVLEDASHRLLSFAHGGPRREHHFRDWRVQSRLAHARGNPGRRALDIESRGRKRGYLVAQDAPPHAAGIGLILSQAATALSIALLEDPTAGHWSRASHETLMGDLLTGRIPNRADAAERLEASGFPLENRTLMGMALRCHDPETTGRTATGHDRLIDGLEQAAQAIGAEVLCTNNPPGFEGILAAVSFRPGPRDPQSQASALARDLGHLAGLRTRIAYGAPATEVSGLLESLDEASLLAGLVPPWAGPEQHRVIHRQGHELALLLKAVQTDPSAQVFAERVLGPLLLHDARHGSDLIQVLSAYLEHPGNRTLAAAASHLSRSVFYQRLATIERLLERPITDGLTLTTLYTALHLHRQSEAR